MTKVKLSKTNSENEEVFKTLTEETGVISCAMVNTDILHPVLKMSSDYLSYNYAFIEEFDNRYYFVRSIDTISGGHILMSLEVDVLMTYREQILELECTVSRNEKRVNNMLNDPEIVLRAKHISESHNFGREVTVDKNDKPYILGIGG